MPLRFAIIVVSPYQEPVIVTGVKLEDELSRRLGDKLGRVSSRQTAKKAIRQVVMELESEMRHRTIRVSDHRVEEGD